MSYSQAESLPAVVRLLCVEDNPDDFELMALALERADPGRRFHLERVEDAQGMAQALAHPFDLVLCDYHLPRFSPQAALALLRERSAPLPLVVVTRAIGEEAAVQVLRDGARDYVTKDRLATLPQVIDRVLAQQAQAREQQRLSRQLEAAYRRLRKQSARLVAAQERERDLISHKLHDQLAQTLAGMVMHLNAARGTPDAGSASRFTDTAIGMAQSAIEQLTSLSFALRPAQLDLLGLGPTVETVLERSAGPAGIDWDLSVRGTAPAAPCEASALALRVVQEAVSNTLRHGNASLLRVRLRFRAQGGVGVLVADDGQGFDGRLPPAQGDGGLHDLIERAELTGGHIRVRSGSGKGVIVRAML